MQRLVKRGLFAVGAPLALATVVGGSLAFAANSSSSSQQQQPSHTWEHHQHQRASFEAQASPTAAPYGNGHSGCDHDGGASSNNNSNADVAGQL
jgi:Tfp pilus assembly protein PilV